MKYINLLMVFLFMNTTNIFGQFSTNDVVFEEEQVRTYLEELNLDVNYNVNLSRLQVIPSDYGVTDDFTKFSRLKFYKLYTACAKGQISGEEKLPTFKEMKEKVFNPNGVELSMVFFDTEYSRFQDIESGRSAVKSYINSKDQNLFREQLSLEYGYATTLTKESLSTKNLDFVLTDLQFLGNKSFDKSSVIIDFGDGEGERTINIDEQYKIRYKSWGAKEVSVSVQTIDGKSIKHIHSLKLEKEPFSSTLRGADLGLT